MAARSNVSISDFSALLDKFQDVDADIRYMTLADLAKLVNAAPPGLLSREVSVTQKLIDSVVDLLDDSNGDVQSQALKCIGPVVQKGPPELVVPLMDKLVYLDTVKSQDKFISFTATRTLILSFPKAVAGSAPSKAVQDAYGAVSRVLIPKLLGRPATGGRGRGQRGQKSPNGTASQDSTKGAEIESLDLLTEVVRCFGPLLQPEEVQALQEKLSEVLDDEEAGSIAKKRAIVALSLLSIYMSDEFLSGFVSSTIENFHSSHLISTQRRVLIMTLGSIVRTIPDRFGPYLKTLSPFVLSAVSQQELNETMEALGEGNVDPAIDELREAAFLTLDDFLLCCSEETQSYTQEIIDGAIRYVTYNPGMLSDDDEMSDSPDDEDELLEEDFEQEEEMDDEDDSSWKIRRSATKVLYSLVSTRGSDLIESGLVYDKILPVLVSRFKEREESVRLEIFSTTTLIIKKTVDTIMPLRIGVGGQTSSLPIHGANPRKRRRGESDPTSNEQALSRGYASPASISSPTSPSRTELLKVGPSIVIEAVKLLHQKAIPTKQAAITLLKTYVQVKHDNLATQLDKVLSPVLDAIKVSHANAGAHTAVSGGPSTAATGITLRIESLQFLATAFDTHSSKIIVPYLNKVIEALVVAINDRYFKIASEALEAAESVIKALTPPRSFGYDEKSKTYLEKIFQVVLLKARSTEVDLEVRHKAVRALGTCLARTADNSRSLSGSRRKEALAFLQERLASEVTRMPAILAIDMILASSKNVDDLSPQWVKSVAEELANQLRKVDRRVRASSLSAIKKLASNEVASRSLDDPTLRTLTTLILPLVNTENLNHLSLATDILASLVTRSPEVVVTADFNSAICIVVMSTLTGHALDSLMALIEVVGKQGAGSALMQDLLMKVGIHGDHAMAGMAIGTLLVSGGSTLPITTQHIRDELKMGQDAQRVALALFVLGEVGLRLGPSSGIAPDVFLGFLQSKYDVAQRAAAISLGRAGAANTQEYLPVIFSALESQSNIQGLILHSIKELLQQSSRTHVDLTAYSQDIWDNLLRISNSEDNRAIGAECLGRLAATEPGKYLPLLQNYLSDPSTSARRMVIQALRFALSDSDETMDDALKLNLLKMLSVMLQETDIENKRLAMTTFYSAVRFKPALILPSLPKLLRYVTKASEINPALIREVQMGPFKHKVDDGLELRKGAYETLHALLDIAYGRMNHAELFDRVIAGLGDEHDVRMLSMLMLTKLIKIDRDETGRRLDAASEGFQGIVVTKLKENAVKQEVERMKEAVNEVLYLTIRLRNEFPEASVNAGNNIQGQAWRAYLEFLRKDFQTQLASAESELKAQE